MPELPEVEVVRRGLEQWVTGRTVATVEVHHPRAVRRHLEGADHFVATLTGAHVHRRPPARQVPLAAAGRGRRRADRPALVGAPRHERPAARREAVRARRDPPARPLHLHRRRPRAAVRRPAHVRRAGGRGAGRARRSPPGSRTSRSIRSTRPSTRTRFTAALRRRHTEVKRALLDQTLIGGVGNIYADEALWRARLHGARPTDKLTRAQVADLLDGVRDVLGEALAQGGTSFDSLYVDVNGQSGYFSRFLAVYGQGDRPCPRCGTPIRRESFMNRSSYSCPTLPAPPAERGAS